MLGILPGPAQQFADGAVIVARGGDKQVFNPDVIVQFQFANYNKVRTYTVDLKGKRLKPLV
jgi:hypothetical protein